MCATSDNPKYRVFHTTHRPSTPYKKQRPLPGVVTFTRIAVVLMIYAGKHMDARYVSPVNVYSGIAFGDHAVPETRIADGLHSRLCYLTWVLVDHCTGEVKAPMQRNRSRTIVWSTAINAHQLHKNHGKDMLLRFSKVRAEKASGNHAKKNNASINIFVKLSRSFTHILTIR